MKIEIKQGSEEFECFGEVFTLYKEIGGVEDNDEYWKNVIYRINDFTEKHNNPLGRELALAIMSVINGETDEQRYSRLTTIVGIKAMNDKRVAQDFTKMAVKVANHWIEQEEG